MSSTTLSIWISRQCVQHGINAASTLDQRLQGYDDGKESSEKREPRRAEERCNMMDLYRSSNYLSSPMNVGVTRKSAHSERVYTLVAAWLADDNGRQRPILGLRRYLPLNALLNAPLHRGQDGAYSRQKMTRPFVLRASLGERIQVQVTNLLAHVPLNLALVDDDFGIMEAGEGPAIAYGESHTYIWTCYHAGVYPMYNQACPDPVERRSLLGVLIVEP
jgi:hypothetical protein